MKVYKCDIEDHYPQRTLVVKYKDNLFKSTMTSYANKNIQNESIVFAAGTEYLRGRVPPSTQVRSTCTLNLMRHPSFRGAKNC